MRESSVCWMYTSPFRLSGVTVVPFNDIFPARNSTRYLVEDPREPGTRLGNRAPEVVILKKQSEARRAASRAQCPTQTLASPAAPRESERARPSQARGCARDRAQPRGLPAPATSLPARAETSPRPARASGAPAARPRLPRPSAAAASRPPAARPSPDARAPTSPPLGPYLAVLTLGLRGAVRDRSSFSAPAGPRRKPALGPPRRRLSSVSRAADPDLIPIGSRRRPSRPARLHAGGLFRRKRGPERPLLLLCHSGAAAAPSGGAGNDGPASADSQRPPRGGAAGSRPGWSTDVQVGLSWLTCTRGPVSAGGHPLGSAWSPLCTSAGRQPV